MSVHSKPNFRCSSSIINRGTRSSLFDVQKMMFEFVRCLIKWYSTHHQLFACIENLDFCCYRAPTDCAQYITGASGYITSYNWQKKEQISGNVYTYCVRREKGYCTIMYQVATGETIDTFQLDDIATSINVSY